MPKTVIFDTNFLLAPHRFHVDIFSETEIALNEKVEFAVTTTIIDEIDKLIQESNPKFKRELLLAKTLARQCKIIDVDLKPGETVDDSLIRVAKEKDFIVATSDTWLRKKLRAEGVRTLALRQRRYIELLN